ncbi:hypothetical protein OR1_02342 [Geobacter sp. OR-1]|uniref:hypothetical protein n=1 Tax=Geobacter sp. OR-1 TaxID=1266765 RepID=UPI000542D0BE|nr:hypothetical protein [Geobacter sp. OR-1]GAM10055.1 hypothetical protein OR1_02342 [Geobacter sp. OR-1]
MSNLKYKEDEYSSGNELDFESQDVREFLDHIARVLARKYVDCMKSAASKVEV